MILGGAGDGWAEVAMLVLLAVAVVMCIGGVLAVAMSQRVWTFVPGAAVCGLATWVVAPAADDGLWIPVATGWATSAIVGRALRRRPPRTQASD